MPLGIFKIPNVIISYLYEIFIYSQRDLQFIDDISIYVRSDRIILVLSGVPQVYNFGPTNVNPYISILDDFTVNIKRNFLYKHYL